MRERLFIVGAGAFGREIESWLTYLPDMKHFELMGYLDPDKNALMNWPSEHQVLGDSTNYEFKKGDQCILALSKPETREKVYYELQGKVKFYTLIFPNVILGKFLNISEGSIICPNSVISTNVELGKCVVINCGTQVGHDVSIGDFSSVMSNTDLGGHCRIGSKCYIGSGVTIIPHKKIGDNSLIGAGSVIINNIKNNISVFGNPGKQIS